MTFPIDDVMETLIEKRVDWNVPVVSFVAEVGADPFKVLVSCLLSLRTRDATTVGAVQRLFDRANTPREMLDLDVEELQRLIYPVGFYRNKAQVIRDVCRALLAEHGGDTGIRDEGLLESALAAPRNKFLYGEEDLFVLAATYAHSLLTNHPFVDGNKRVALVTTGVFLDLNG